MKRIETTLDNAVNDIGAFYKAAEHHFMVMNAVDMGDKMELQWFFCDYAHPCEVTAFCAQAPADALIPSIKGIVDSAWVAEAELTDLMNINIEGAAKGFVLEPDFESGPLRKKK